MLQDYILKHGHEKKIIIFSDTKAECESFKSKDYAHFMLLHGDLAQKERQQVLNLFRQKDCKSILVATDVAARGLDIDDIDVVVHFSVRHVDSVVHRSGRTGRAGKAGTNLIFCSKSELPFMKECEDNLNIVIKYTNSLGSQDSELLMWSEVQRLISSADKPVAHTDSHLDALLEHYSQLDQDLQQSFFKNMMGELLAAKRVLNHSPQVGIVTGRDNMKTYSFTHDIDADVAKEMDEYLRDHQIKFVREKTEGKYNTYLVDLEPMSTHVSLLEEKCTGAQLTEINHIPDEFKRTLLRGTEPVNNATGSAKAR